MATAFVDEPRVGINPQALTLDAPDSAPKTIPRPYCGGQEPLFLAALAFSSGIVAADYLWRSPGIWLAGFVLAALAAVISLRRSPQLGFALILIAVVPLGGFYLQARDAAEPVIADNLGLFANSEDAVAVIAHVTREGLIRDSPYGGKQESVDVESEQIRVADRVLREPIGMRLTLYSRKS